MVRLLLSLEGRASRSEAWRGLAPLQLVLCATVAIDVAYRPPLPAASLAIGLILLWPTIAVAVKRFHDRGLSGWWMLWLLLLGTAGAAAALMDLGSLAVWGGRAVTFGSGLIAFAVIYVTPGQKQPNDFGAPPGGADRHPTMKVDMPMSAVAVRRPDRPCRPVPQTFKGMKEQVAALFEPSPLPPGARATFGRRGE